MIAEQPMIDAPDLDRALDAFRRDYPAFDDTRALDDMRATEYARLDALGQVYLDYTGGGLYAESQLREHMALLSQNVFGNPHSRNPTSMAMTHLVERARAAVLEFFNASADEYTAIFTPNASGALKLVGEGYPFAPGGRLQLVTPFYVASAIGALALVPGFATLTIQFVPEPAAFALLGGGIALLGAIGRARRD